MIIGVTAGAIILIGVILWIFIGGSSWSKETQKMFLDDYCSLNEEYCDCYMSAVQNEINEEFAIKALTTSRWSATEEELEKWTEALENAKMRCFQHAADEYKGPEGTINY